MRPRHRPALPPQTTQGTRSTLSHHHRSSAADPRAAGRPRGGTGVHGTSARGHGPGARRPRGDAGANATAPRASTAGTMRHAWAAPPRCPRRLGPWCSPPYADGPGVWACRSPYGPCRGWPRTWPSTRGVASPRQPSGACCNRRTLGSAAPSTSAAVQTRTRRDTKDARRPPRPSTPRRGVGRGGRRPCQLAAHPARPVEPAGSTPQDSHPRAAVQAVGPRRRP